MSFGLFAYNDNIENLIAMSQDSNKKLQDIANALKEGACPQYLINFINTFSSDDGESLAIHSVGSIDNYKDEGTDIENISRSRGLMGRRELELQKYPKAVHHIKIFRNYNSKAKLFYKYTTTNVGFISRTRKTFL